jgi:hypothetical protein
MTTTTTVSSTSYGSNIGGLPLGVAIIAILIGVFGFFVLLAGILLLVFGTAFVLGGGSLTVFGYTGAVAGLIILILGIVILAVASGLWNQELWALALAIIVLAFYGIVEYLNQAWIALLIVVLLIVYLVAVSNHFD